MDALSGAELVLPGTVLGAYETALASVNEALGEEACAAARAAGRTLPPEAAIADAMALATDLHQSDGRSLGE